MLNCIFLGGREGDRQTSTGSVASRTGCSCIRQKGRKGGGGPEYPGVIFAGRCRGKIHVEINVEIRKLTSSIEDLLNFCSWTATSEPSQFSCRMQQQPN